jgi:hypothetical protein
MQKTKRQKRKSNKPLSSKKRFRATVLEIRMSERYGGMQSPQYTPGQMKSYFRLYAYYNSNLGAVVKKIFRSRNQGGNLRNTFGSYEIKAVYEVVLAKRNAKKSLTI